jgi:hypothetical protein
VFRSDCKVFGCISSKSEQNWCFELVEGYLAFVWCSVLYLILYIISYTIIHYYYYITIISYTIIIHILYYTLLFCSSSIFLFSSSSILPTPFLLSLPLQILPSHPNIHLPSILLPSSLLPIQSSSSQYSFYTCRYLHILIYILFQYSSHLIFPSLSSPSPHSHLIHFLFCSSSSLPSSLLFLPNISSSIFFSPLTQPHIHSILVGTWVRLFIFSHSRII